MAFLFVHAGLTSRPFRGHESVQEVDCSGEGHDPDASIFFMVLYRSPGNIVASLNVATEECLTNDAFSSCIIDRKNSRKSRLRTLVVDLDEGQQKWFACNVTGVVSVARTKVMSWKLLVKRISKFTNPYCCQFVVIAELARVARSASFRRLLQHILRRTSRSAQGHVHTEHVTRKENEKIR
ncbi:hypothetical protein BaRGS_00018491 [Batillaria attramentaria]|uniref:Uncharacterized protein n=1 Tax=Batillaria attramentaria TaxID=370345 RepID=A0ABD0KU23_9CAEN